MCYCDPSIRTIWCNKCDPKNTVWRKDSMIAPPHNSQQLNMNNIMEKEIRKAQLRFLNIFIEELEDKLMERTSWGRNDLKDELKNIKLGIIEKALVE